MIVVALLFENAHAAFAEKPTLPGPTTILDPDIYLYSWPYPSISPDGNWVAYVSKGFVCVCNVSKPAPRQIREVPNSYTWPHLIVSDGDTSKTGTFESLSRGLSRERYIELHAQISRTVYGLNWVHDSSGFVFGIQEYDVKKKQATYDVYFVSVSGEVANLAHISPDARVRAITAGVLTSDRKFLVSPVDAASSERYRPLIWNVKESKPRATPFLYLTPSTTSDRWLGIEKDTKQLVITDENFEVIKRFDETMPNKSFGLRIEWSPDERFLIWRNQIGFDYYSNWEGFWLDLQTGEKRNLDGWFMGEQIAFTGRGGEFFRFGADGGPHKLMSGNQITGSHFTFIPNGKAPPHDVFRFVVDPTRLKSDELASLPGSPPLRMNSDGSLFVINFPRVSDGRADTAWYLINREGKKWHFPGTRTGESISPCQIAGFADNGKNIVAYDSTRLFALPVLAIMVGENEAK
jgi:hypothetical protein